jgi:hypothetical protein
VETLLYRWIESGLWQQILADLQRQGDVAGPIDWSLHMPEASAYGRIVTPLGRAAVDRDQGGAAGLT